MPGTKCPISCGQCCSYWRDVPELCRSEGPYCPHEGTKGCRLYRKNRPVACTEYLCDVAQAVLDKKITLKEAVSMKEDGLEFLPYRDRNVWNFQPPNYRRQGR